MEGGGGLKVRNLKKVVKNHMLSKRGKHKFNENVETELSLKIKQIFGQAI